MQKTTKDLNCILIWGVDGRWTSFVCVLRICAMFARVSGGRQRVGLAGRGEDGIVGRGR
ncbi:MAG: hypothetical protein BYD32DRAFT_417547 [Podila humilis]|nr:MAG: hypothetical protein BYD32DRAFT_417547 [Podila humilis]